VPLSRRGARGVNGFARESARVYVRSPRSAGWLKQVPSTLKESDETWTFGFYPGELASYLAERGFTLITDIGSVEYRARYMGASGPHLNGFEFYRAVLAEVRSSPFKGP
jgi:O-methyltransferase involved in polyketide biosynthesis